MPAGTAEGGGRGGAGWWRLRELAGRVRRRRRAGAMAGRAGPARRRQLPLCCSACCYVAPRCAQTQPAQHVWQLLPALLDLLLPARAAACTHNHSARMQYKWALWQIDNAGTTVVIAAVGDKGSTYADFLAALPESDCRYGGAQGRAGTGLAGGNNARLFRFPI